MRKCISKKIYIGAVDGLPGDLYAKIPDQRRKISQYTTLIHWLTSLLIYPVNAYLAIIIGILVDRY
jgi:hypothetical protein